jgi:hypothetical protein
VLQQRLDNLFVAREAFFVSTNVNKINTSMDGSMRVYGALIKLIGPISPKADFETKLETLVSPVAASRRLQRTVAGSPSMGPFAAYQAIQVRDGNLARGNA